MLRLADDRGAAFRLSEPRLLVMPLRPGVPMLAWSLPNMPLEARPLGSVGERRPSSPGCCAYVAPNGGCGEPYSGLEPCLSWDCAKGCASVGEMLELGDLAEDTEAATEALGPMEPKPTEAAGALAPPAEALTGGRGSPALAATETEELCEAPDGVSTAVIGRGGRPWGGAGRVEAGVAFADGAPGAVAPTVAAATAAPLL